MSPVDPLSFRPNIAALTEQSNSASMERGKRNEQDESQDADATSSRDRGDGIYRPPRLAPVVYNAEAGASRGKDKGRTAPRNSALLADLSSSMSANPYEISSGGVGVNGGSGANASARAKALRRMDQYEEENFTRLGMSKRDAKRRRRDEADVALGGAGLSSKRGRVGAGLEEEFGDLLRNSGRDDLKNVKRKGALQRSRDGRTAGNDREGGGFDEVLGGSGSSGAADAKFRRQIGRSKSKTQKRR
jgi:U3 small nucleolar ribonucleoprotein protein LCP5